jgi:transcriptional regulator with XRE-family HTH domain
MNGMQYDLQKFCIIISELRKQKGWSQNVLADKIGISPQSVSKWECGIGYPDVTMFPTLAEIFSVPIGVLFGEKKTEIGAVRTKGNTFYAPDYKRIYVELGNVCRVVFVGDKEQDGLVLAMGDPVFLQYFDAELEEGELRVILKNPLTSLAGTHWEPYDRGGYDGENLVEIHIDPDRDICKTILNYLDLLVYSGENVLGQDEILCCPPQ